MLCERTVSGLHDHLARFVLGRHATRGKTAVDLGAGSGALAVRLRNFGLEVTAVDINQEGFGADLPFVRLDLNRPDFSTRLGDASFDFVNAVEVIEHLESPLSFLRNVHRLLRPTGIALVTTPNMDSAPARLRHLLTGKLHMMDERVPNHITPIFFDLLTRVYLPRAGLELIEHHLYPPNGYRVSHASYAWALRVIARLLPGKTLLGDIHIFVLKADQRM